MDTHRLNTGTKLKYRRLQKYWEKSLYFPDQSEVCRPNSLVLPYGFVLLLNVLSDSLMSISFFYKTCISARARMKKVVEWSYNYVLAHHWLFCCVTSLASGRSYSGVSFIRLQLTCSPDSATFKFCLVDRGIQLEPRPRYVS